MTRKAIITAGKQRKLPLLGVAGAFMLALPSAGLAVVGFSPATTDAGVTDTERFGTFTPASVDPEFAARIADKARAKGIRFTPAGTDPVLQGKTVTVAVRIDNDIAKAVSVRSAIKTAPAASNSLAALQTSRFNLGTARGYQSFARQTETRKVDLSSSVQNLSAPDLAEFEPSQPLASKKPSRLQPRIELQGEAIAGRSANTLDALGAQTVDVGGSFSLSPNLNVTAGVRYSQERERLSPLTNAEQDSQAVYVGTQIKF